MEPCFLASHFGVKQPGMCLKFVNKFYKTLDPTYQLGSPLRCDLNQESPVDLRREISFGAKVATLAIRFRAVNL